MNKMKNFKIVSEKESIFSYLAGRDERYNEIDKLVEDYNSKMINNQDVEQLSKQIQQTVDTIHNRHGSKGSIRRQ